MAGVVAREGEKGGILVQQRSGVVSSLHGKHKDWKKAKSLLSGLCVASRKIRCAKKLIPQDFQPIDVGYSLHRLGKRRVGVLTSTAGLYSVKKCGGAA